MVPSCPPLDILDHDLFRPEKRPMSTWCSGLIKGLKHVVLVIIHEGGASLKAVLKLLTTNLAIFTRKLGQTPLICSTFLLHIIMNSIQPLCGLSHS